jgi:hypothetical protein
MNIQLPINNDFIIYTICSITVCVISGLIIKNYFYHTTNGTQTPPTFNLTHQQVKELNDILDKGEEISEENLNKLDEDFHKILGEEDAKNYEQEMKQIQEEMNKALEDLFNNMDFFN